MTEKLNEPDHDRALVAQAVQDGDRRELDAADGRRDSRAIDAAEHAEQMYLMKGEVVELRHAVGPLQAPLRQPAEGIPSTSPWRRATAGWSPGGVGCGRRDVVVHGREIVWKSCRTRALSFGKGYSLRLRATNPASDIAEVSVSGSMSDDTEAKRVELFGAHVLDDEVGDEEVDALDLHGAVDARLDQVEAIAEGVAVSGLAGVEVVGVDVYPYTASVVSGSMRSSPLPPAIPSTPIARNGYAASCSPVMSRSR